MGCLSLPILFFCYISYILHKIYNKTAPRRALFHVEHGLSFDGVLDASLGTQAEAIGAATAGLCAWLQRH